MKFYEGGIQYKDAIRMSLYELIEMNDQARRINKEVKDTIG